MSDDDFDQHSIHALSIEYVKVPVFPPVGVTISAQPVYLAFTALGEDPEEGDWETGAWSGTTARILVGPGQAVELDAGQSYWVWVKVSDQPEIPVICAGTIHVTGEPAPVV